MTTTICMYSTAHYFVQHFNVHFLGDHYFKADSTTGTSLILQSHLEQFGVQCLAQGHSCDHTCAQEEVGIEP